MDGSPQEVQLRIRISGPNIDREELLVRRQGLRVGRSGDGNNLTLDHREISRNHMRIVWSDDDYFLVEDLNSTNGVWLNETRLVPRVPVRINIGDVIRAGPFVMRVDDVEYVSVPLEPRQIIAGEPSDLPTPPGPPSINGTRYITAFLPGIPRLKSTWMKYLPEVYSEDEFLGRYLLIAEAMLSPIIWIIDNFDLYLTPDIAPEAWLEWMAAWFDLLLLPNLPIDRQRQIVNQIGWLFLRRGTRQGLARLLELYFGVPPEIIETETCHFIVRLPLSQAETQFGREVAERLIDSQRPAFASYALEIT
jgi:phage tail-like protein